MAKNYKITGIDENVIMITGRVGRDPEWLSVGSGLCKFSVAQTKSWKSKDTGEWVEKTNWLTCRSGATTGNA